MNNSRTEMRLLNILDRKSTFKEVALGYNHDEMLEEANRCLNCKNPACVSGCPVNINIPGFINHLKNDDVDKAYVEISKQSSLPGVCGRVCPQEKQCEGKCVRGIKGDAVAIGRLERYVADNVKEKKTIEVEKNGKKIAIVGSGPAGLACASEALNLGFDVTIYEALHIAGGVLSYGIPEFRLPKTIVNKEIQDIVNRGAKLYTNYVIGKTILLEELLDQFDAIFVGTGAGVPRFMNIPGEGLNGVLSSNEFLTRNNLMKGYLDNYDTPIKKAKNVVVVGGGNVAMDAARCAKRLGANVTLVYRRSIEEMPARLEEIHHAIEEDIVFNTLTNPIEIIGDEHNFVKSVKCQKMELGEPDSSGRRSFNPIPGAIIELECDLLIMAIGNFPNPILRSSTKEIEFSNRGLIVVDENLMTTNEKIYAGGDIVTGAATVISAMGAGKKVANEIYKKLCK